MLAYRCARKNAVGPRHTSMTNASDLRGHMLTGNDESNEHALTPYLRRRLIEPARAAFLYRLYLLLRNAPDSVSADSKQRSFEAAATGAHHWDVVAISEHALFMLHLDKNIRLVRRGHAFSRKARFRHLFGPDTDAFEQDALMRFYFEQDASALVTARENATDGTQHWSKLYAVPEHLFHAAGFSVKYRKKVEHAWVVEQVAKMPRPPISAKLVDYEHERAT